MKGETDFFFPTRKVSGACVLQRSHKWSIANCEEMMPLLRSTDYLWLCIWVPVLLLLSASWFQSFLCAPSSALWNRKTRLSSSLRIRVCLFPGKSISNSSIKVGIQAHECQLCFLLKDHQRSMKKTPYIWREKEKEKNILKNLEALCYISVCPLPVPGGTELTDKTEPCKESE